MKKLHLPYVRLPREFTALLKVNLSVVSSPSQVFDSIRPNRALYSVLERAFKEFDDGRGLEKLLTALGWSNFRERMAGLYVYKSIYGDFPSKTSMELVEDIRKMETAFQERSVHGYSRLFLLGFYVKMANIQIQTQGGTQEIRIGEELNRVLGLSQVRSEKIDWLLLITLHLVGSLGEATLVRHLSEGKKFAELYGLLSSADREDMHNNLLAYGASIHEPDFFLYEKV